MYDIIIFCNRYAESLELTKMDFKERHIAERTVCFINQEIPFLKKLVPTKKILIFLIVACGHCQTPTASGPDRLSAIHPLRDLEI